MKQLLFLFVALFVLTNLSSGQNCKYERNDFDKFTKQEIKITKPILLWKNPMGGNSLSFKAKSYAGQLFLEMRYSNSSIFTIDEGSGLMFMLEDSSILKLKAVKTVISDYYIAGGSTTWFVESNYKLNKEQAELLMNSKLLIIRVMTTEGYIEKDIKSKKAVRLAKIISCVL